MTASVRAAALHSIRSCLRRREHRIRGDPDSARRTTYNSPGASQVDIHTIRDLNVGDSFKFFARFRDGQRRPQFRWGAESTRLHRAYLRIRNHALGPCVLEIKRSPFDFRQQLTVVEHLKGDVTMVRDEQYRLAPIYSGLRLRPEAKRKPQQQSNGGRR